MKATSSELLIRNFNEIFIELDPLKRAALLAKVLHVFLIIGYTV